MTHQRLTASDLVVSFIILVLFLFFLKDGDVLSRENVVVMTSRSVTEHKTAVPPRYREFSVNSVISSAPNHEVHVHPSQSAIYMSTPRKQPPGPSLNDKGAGGLTKRASNPETNPYQRQGYYDGMLNAGIDC